MTGYELVFITDPSQNNEELASVLKNYKKILTKSGGKLIHEYVWGRRRLAYEISGKEFGVYHAWYFTGTGKTIDELQRQIGYSDEVLRYQIIKTNDIDTEAAFLQTLIPPKEDATENEETPKESEETLKETEEITGESTKVKKESPKKAEVATENEKNITEDVKEVDTESEVKIEKSDKDAEEVETVSVDA